MRRVTAILSFATLTLGGFASMSKEECLHADWRAIGYEDGAAGAPVSAISNRRTACVKKVGAAPDMAEYLAGREQGLRLYCQPSNGYRLGASGARYQGVCAGPDSNLFTAAYQSGLHLHQLQFALDSAAHALSKAHKDLRAVKHHITEVEAALVSPDTSNPSRIELLAELKNLSEERGRIETAIVALARDEARAEDELTDYQAYLAENGPYPSRSVAPERASFRR